MKASSPEEMASKVRSRKRAYMAAFSTPGSAGFEALKDLAQFCRAFGGEVAPSNHDATLIMAGRREAFFRIWDHLKLEPDEMVELYRMVRIEGDE